MKIEVYARKVDTPDEVRVSILDVAVCIKTRED